MSNGLRERGRSHAWPLSARASVALVLGCIGVGVAVGLALHRGATTPATDATAQPATALWGDAVWASGQRLAPSFALRDQRNRPVSLTGQRGHPVVLAFMDSHCKVVCRIEGPVLGRALARAREINPAHAQATLVVVSVNPWQDTAASTRAAAAHWQLGNDWLWLRGSEARLRPLWRAYGIAVKRTRGDVSHSTAIYLIDRTGHERAGFNFPFTAGDVVHDLRLLRNAGRTT